MNVSQMLEKLEALVRPLLEPNNVELVDLSFQKEHETWVLRLLMDKPGGITLDDCGIWGDRVGTLLDETDLISQAYTLEVSSPGVDRPLKKLSDFIRFSGERVAIKLFSPIDGQKNFHGTLLGADEENIRIQLDDHREISLPRNQVAKAKLDPVIEF